MNEPTKENIATVMSGFEKFFEHMIQTQNFNRDEFVNFMEPIFKATGYRDVLKYNVHNDSGEECAGNILILTEMGAGDFIVTTGAIREIRRIYSAAHITMVVHPRAFELAECCPYVDEIILNPQKYSLKNLLEIYKSNMNMANLLLEQRFDICFSFPIHPQLPLLMYMSGAKIRITPIWQIVLRRICRFAIPILHVVGILTVCRVLSFSPRRLCPNAKILSTMNLTVAGRTFRTA